MASMVSNMCSDAQHARTDEQNFSLVWVFIWPCSTIQLDTIDLSVVQYFQQKWIMNHG